MKKFGVQPQLLPRVTAETSTKNAAFDKKIQPNVPI